MARQPAHIARHVRLVVVALVGRQVHHRAAGRGKGVAQRAVQPRNHLKLLGSHAPVRHKAPFKLPLAQAHALIRAWGIVVGRLQEGQGLQPPCFTR